MENTMRLYSFQKRITEEATKNKLIIPRIPDDKIECWGWEINYENEFIYVSMMVRSLLGYQPDELLFHSFYEFIAEEEVSLIKERAIRYRMSKKPCFSFKTKMRKKDGEYIEINVNGLGVFDGNENLCGYEGVVIVSKDEIIKIKLSQNQGAK